jgi:hypothetical protein
MTGFAGYKAKSTQTKEYMTSIDAMVTKQLDVMEKPFTSFLKSAVPLM